MRAQRASDTRVKGQMDHILMLMTLVLCAIGVIMVFSSSYYYSIEKNGDMFYFLIPNLKWLGLGAAAMLIASAIDYRVYQKLAIPAMVIAVVMLIYVLVRGPVVKDVKRWIFVGGQGFQPAEIAKIAAILFFAAALARNHERLNRIGFICVYLFFIGGFVVLIMKQPNMSMAMIFLGVLFSMLVIAGLKWRYVIGIVGIGSMGAWFAIKHSEYRYLRLIAFLDPLQYKTDESWQVIQSLYALGTGGISGVGPGMSTQNKLYIPEPQNDFILATIGEEFGFLGTVLLLLLFVIFLYRCTRIAINAPDEFSMLFSAGITSMFGIQVIMNYAVATSSMPVTGVTLPFISYGGTSTVIMMTAVGILLSISKYMNPVPTLDKRRRAPADDGAQKPKKMKRSVQ